MKGRTYSGKVAVRVAPALEVRVEFDEKDTRTYKGAELAAGEFVTDAEDVLGYRAWVHRLDKPADEVVAQGVITRMWIGTGNEADAKFKLELEADPEEKGVWRGKLSSVSLMLLTSAPVAYKLHAEAYVPGKDGLRIEVPRLDMPVTPCLLHLSFWVVPGSRQGTSEAGALLCVSPNAARRLTGHALHVRVDGPGGLAAESETATTDDEGKAEWILRWSGLGWDALGAAKWTVRCGIEEPDGSVKTSVSVSIDLGANVSSLLKDLLAAEGRLQLFNPSLTRGSGALATVGDYFFPDFCSGPLWNTFSFARLDWDNIYVCNALRDRIYEWMQTRRFGESGTDPNDMACMNGVEISRYAIAPIHVWAGIHLSGSGPDADPRMLDPWWRQEWRSPEYASAAGLMSWNGELSRLAGSLAAGVAIVVVLAKLLVGYSILASAAAFKAWILGGTAGAYAAGAGATATTVGGYTFLCGSNNGTSVVNGVYQSARAWLKDVGLRWRREKRALAPMQGVSPW